MQYTIEMYDDGGGSSDEVITLNGVADYLKERAPGRNRKIVICHDDYWLDHNTQSQHWQLGGNIPRACETLLELMRLLGHISVSLRANPYGN